MKLFISTFLLLSGLISSLYSEEYKFEMKGVKATLISEVKSILPGQKFTVALYIQHFDDFHTYWKNPGLVGFATSMQWDLPDGFKAGEIRWQVPERSKMLKYNCHAYKGDTYLLVDVTAPQVIPDKFRIAAKVGGMSCSTKECCKIGYLDVGVDLVKSSKVEYNPDSKVKIELAKSRLPSKIEGFSFKAKRKGNSIILEVSSEKLPRVEGLYFYSEENISDTEQKQLFTLKDSKLVLNLKLNNFADADLKVLKGLLYSNEGWAGRKQKYLLVDCSLD